MLLIIGMTHISHPKGKVEGLWGQDTERNICI